MAFCVPRGYLLFLVGWSNDEERAALFMAAGVALAREAQAIASPAVKVRTRSVLPSSVDELVINQVPKSR